MIHIPAKGGLSDAGAMVGERVTTDSANFASEVRTDRDRQHNQAGAVVDAGFITDSIPCL